MARKNKAETEKADSVAEPQAKAKLTDEQLRALVTNHAGRIGPVKQELRDIQNELATLYKAAKKEGVSRKDLDLFLSLQAASATDVQAEAERRAKIIEWVHPGVQASFLAMFDTDQEAVAEKKGYQAGLEGKTCKPPYDPGSVQAQHWIDGWAKGQAQVANRITKLGEPDEDDFEETDVRPSFLRNNGVETRQAMAA